MLVVCEMGRSGHSSRLVSRLRQQRQIADVLQISDKRKSKRNQSYINTFADCAGNNWKWNVGWGRESVKLCRKTFSTPQEENSNKLITPTKLFCLLEGEINRFKLIAFKRNRWARRKFYWEAQTFQFSEWILLCEDENENHVSSFAAICAVFRALLTFIQPFIMKSSRNLKRFLFLRDQAAWEIKINSARWCVKICDVRRIPLQWLISQGERSKKKTLVDDGVNERRSKEDN